MENAKSDNDMNRQPCLHQPPQKNPTAAIEKNIKCLKAYIKTLNERQYSVCSLGWITFIVSH